MDLKCPSLKLLISTEFYFKNDRKEWPPMSLRSPDHCNVATVYFGYCHYSTRERERDKIMMKTKRRSGEA